MTITEFGVENFKSVGALQNMELAKVNLIFGANSVGKSSFLQALGLLQNLMRTTEIDIKMTFWGSDIGGFDSFVHKRDSSKLIRFFVKYDMPELGFEEGQNAVSANIYVDKSGIGMIKFSVNDKPLILIGRASTMSKSHLIHNGFSIDILDPESPLISDAVKESKKAIEKIIHSNLDSVSEGQSSSLIEAYLQERSSISINRLIQSLNAELDREKAEMLSRSQFQVHETFTNDEKYMIDIPWNKEWDDYPPYYSQSNSKISTKNYSRILGEIFSMDPVDKEKLSDSNVLFKPFDSDINKGIDRTPISDSLIDGSAYKSIGFILERIDGYLIAVIAALLKRIVIDIQSYAHLGPLRSYPHRLTTQNSIEYGEDTLENSLWQSIIDSKYVRNSVNYEMQILGMKYEIDTLDLIDASQFDKILREFKSGAGIPFHHERYTTDRQLVVRDRESGINVSTRDVGVGVSQVLPILIRLFSSQGITSIEQPELHLHPKMQSKLADSIIRSLNGKYDSQIILETHSEHIILRLLKRIRDSKNSYPTLKAEDLRVYYAMPSKSGLQMVRLDVGDDGAFIDPWPDGFFDERIEEFL